tara:strand:- start:2959 stop:3756 length:798 start_codon:yes stop_codon:yes gene_type:complete
MSSKQSQQKNKYVPITDNPNTQKNELAEANAKWRKAQGMSRTTTTPPPLGDKLAQRKTNLKKWGVKGNPIVDDPTTDRDELAEANARWRLKQQQTALELSKTKDIVQELKNSREKILSSNWTNEGGLTAWQDYAAKTLHTRNEPLMLLMFHDENIAYITERARKKTSMATSLPSGNPSNQQIVVTLLIIYDNMKERSRKDLKKLLIEANKKAVEAIVKKLVTNTAMYSHYYHDKITLPQPIPGALSVNVNKAGMRSLSGGKPFVI